MRKKEKQDGRQTILTIAGVLLLRSLGFWVPKDFIIRNCWSCSVAWYVLLGFEIVVFSSFFFHSSNSFGLCFFYDVCLLFAGYVLCVCFILLLSQLRFFVFCSWLFFVCDNF